MESLTHLAPAKINLFLHIIGKRRDGYHTLESLVVFAKDEAACDVVSIAPAKDLHLEISGVGAEELQAEVEKNHVMRAGRLLQSIAPGHGAAIKLHKRLPAAAGIGGGSSDAAAALHGLRRLWNIAIDDTSLEQTFVKIGADMPVCLRGTPTYMEGIGDILHPVEGLPPIWLVLANPGVTLSTKDVFIALAGQYGPSLPLERRPDSAADLAILLRARRNDLEAPARFLAPEIDPVLTALRAQNGCLLARLSGSGATCFGLFAAKRDADFAARNISRAYPKWWVAATAAG